MKKQNFLGFGRSRRSGDDIQPGDGVKAIFQDKERMWVYVTKVSGNRTGYDPETARELKGNPNAVPQKANYPQSAKWHTIADFRGVKSIAYTGPLKAAQAAGEKLQKKGYGVNLMPAPADAQSGWMKHWQRELKNPHESLAISIGYRSRKEAEAQLKHLKQTLSPADWNVNSLRIVTQHGEMTGQTLYRVAAKPNLSKRNPEAAAAELSELFHGHPAEEIEVSKTRIQDHEWLTKLGWLTEMKFVTLTNFEVTMTWIEAKTNAVKKDAPSLAVSENGKQLYIEGGNQEVDLSQFGMDGAEWKRDSMTLGVLRKIQYRTRKKFDKDVETDYFHTLGEETGVQPLLIYDPNNRLLSVSGGQYEILTDRLVEGMSPGLGN